MFDFESSINQLKKSAQSPFTSLKRLTELTQQMIESSRGQSPHVLDQALDSLLVAVATAKLDRSAVMAVGCGALVEGGAAAEIAWPVVYRQLQTALELVQLKQADPEADLAHAIDNLCLAGIALLSRSADLRVAAREGGLLEQLQDVDTSGTGFLLDLLKVFEDEQLLVFYPGLWRGYRLRISGVADNFQLHTLLADGLSGDPAQGWLPIDPPDPRVVAAARDQHPDPEMDVNFGSFNLVSCTGLRPDGTLNEDQEHWIWGEGLPADIPLFEGRRIILLGPPPYERYWNAARRFSGLKADLLVEEILDHEQVKTWLNRIASDNAGVAVELDGKSPRILYNWGMAYLKASYFQKAIEALSECTRLAPNFAEAYYQRGNARRQVKDYPGAIEDYNLALRYSPDQAEWHTYLLNRGVARSLQGDMEGAFEDYEYAIQLNPQYALAYNNLGHLLYQQGDYQEAIRNYDRAIEYEPEFALAYTNRGLARQEQGDYSGALSDHQRAIELHPRFAVAYTNRGLLRQGQGDYSGAIADYSQTIQIDDQDSVAYYNRGLARRLNNDLQGAIEDYSQAIQLDPEFKDAYQNRAAARKRNGDLEGAIADWTQVIELKPDQAKAYFNRGNLLAETGDLPGAINDLSQAIQLEPGEAAAYDNRGNLLGRMGDSQGAMADFTKAIQLNPQLTSAHLNMGVEHMKQGNHRAAVERFTKALRLDPQSVLALSNRAAAHTELENYKAAVEDCSQALRLNPQHASAYNNRAYANLKLGRSKQALPDCNRAIELRQHAYFYRTRGQVLAALGDLRGAISDFEQALVLMPGHPEAQEMQAEINVYRDKIRGRG